MSNLKVAVRVRPISQRELDIRSTVAVLVENGVISVTNIKVPKHHAGDSRERIRKFAFDYCYGENSTQDEIFEMIEAEVSQALSKRYNACVLAYGQSSTGKTYTMMGLQDEPGLTPRLCENIFKYFQSSVTEDEIKEVHTSVSYLEIYNERVQDLLVTSNNGKTLKVREHPKKGPYVQGLTEHRVESADHLLTWLRTGNGNRRVAATSTNRRSSRSHSVLTISCSSGSRCTKLHLVDLAGSERASHGAAPRLKEGANINRSLVALGNVICALADQSARSTKYSRKRFVPYRDSVLTWLLKETLGGNSKTVMIATISPSSACYSETVNTLRFGQRAKQIINRPVVNEDAKEKLIRELKAEIQRLKDLLNLHQQVTSPDQLSTQSNSDVAMSDLLKPNENFVEGTDEESTLSQTETDDVESSDTLMGQNIAQTCKENPEEIPESINEIKEIKSEDTKLSTLSEKFKENLENLSSFTKTDKLIPVIDITSTVKPKSVKSLQLSRTFSVDFPKSIIGNFKRDFGSHETLSNTSIQPVPTILKNRRSSFKQSIENLTKNLKSKEIVSKIEKPGENSSRSGSISESSGKSTPRKNPIQTRRVHRRSEVVAAVTQRLYSQQVKRKELQKKDEEKSMGLESSSPFPRQNICSNARMRLQELTQRALRASKRKVHEETQTEDHSTVRLKEKSTDVQDMNITLLKVKDANISAVADMKNIGVSCHVENYHKTIKLTRSCSSQTDEQPKNQSVSFTKYLKNPPLAIHSYAQPIYTSSVNINVSHNYPSQKEEISDDSLEDLSHQKVQYSTPDLISNHNSLEQHSIQKQSKSTSTTEEKLISHTNTDKFPEKVFQNEYFATNCTEYCIAESIVIPPVSETISDVTIPIVCAAEIRKATEFNETCAVFSENKPDFAKYTQTYEPLDVIKSKCYVLNDSKNVKSKIRTKFNVSDCTTEESDTDSSISYNKKVCFSPQLKRKNMVNVLQNFMDEASSLLIKLNAVAEQVEKSEELRNKRTFITKQKIKNTYSDLDTKECYVQTYLPYHDASAQTTSKIIDFEESSSSFEMPVTELQPNKWEQILKSSCDKLEQCVKLAEHKSREDERRRFHNDIFENSYGQKCLQPFSTDTDWRYCPNEFSSLETTHSASDYGSLPRKEGLFRRNTYRHYSPKAYMKQLVAMRKQIVETSRNDLMEELKLPLSEQ